MTAGRTSTFSVAELHLGLGVDRVAEVVPDLPVVPVPLSHPSIRGLVNLRGRILTVIDARIRLGLNDQIPAQVPGVHVIVTRGAEAASLLVDAALDVVDLADVPGEDVPDTVSPWIRSLTTSACQLQGDLLLVMDADSLTDVTVNPRQT